MAGAQQLASVNRRLVTTDSFDLPVTDAPLPEWVRESAAKYVAVLSTPPSTLPNTPLPAGSTAEDVFRLFTGVEFSKAKIVNLLAYRFQEQRYLRHGMYVASTNPNGAYNTTVAAEKALLDQQVGALAQQLLAPEVIAGMKMDLNRPFGDGQDNNGDGVVDDPMEAGDPFLDVNGNGQWDTGEPFINLDGSVDASGNPTYTPPMDRMWQSLGPVANGGNGTLAEPISFDYTNGIEVPVYKSTIAGGVKNLESQGRQLFARQLYCLTLLLTDENYVAPLDGNDPQIMTWAETTKTAITTALAGSALQLHGNRSRDPGRPDRQTKAHLPFNRAVGD